MYNKKSREQLLKEYQKETFLRKTVSFYKYCPIKNPQEYRDSLYKSFEKLNIFGRIYIAEEGINAQISVPENTFKLFLSILDSDQILQGIQLKFAVEDGLSFLKLKVIVKKEIVAYGVKSHEYDMNHTGKHLTPVEYNQSIEDKDSIVVDMRNYYESEVGRFQNAITPDAHFSKELLPMVATQLAGLEDKKIHLYCTGGIRCEKASAYLIQKGFKEVYQLEGGIIQYAQDQKKYGFKSQFIGKNFVFDDRMSERITEHVLAQCHQCSTKADSHKNCANQTCHLLFIQCEDCAQNYQDCCSKACQEYVRLPKEEQLKNKDLENKRLTSLKLSTKFRPKLKGLHKDAV